MTVGIVERVARAIALNRYRAEGLRGVTATGQQMDEPTWVEINWRNYAGDAVAALKAAREPTDLMTNAGANHFDNDMTCGTPSQAEYCYRDMIDAALAEVVPVGTDETRWAGC